MKTCLAYVLAALVLLQTFSREVLVVDYALNKATITARFCVNKARPQLHCNGRCYFAKQLKKQQERENKSPNPLKERLEMLPQATGVAVPARPTTYRVSLRFGRLPSPAVPDMGLRAIFHPPQRG